MNVLIVYGTYSGGTLLTAELIGEVLKKHQHAVTIQNVFDTEPEIFAKYDLVIFGSCTWLEEKKDGQLHTGFEQFKTKLTGKIFEDKRFAVYALGDKNFLHFCYAANHLQDLVRNLKGREIVPAMRINQFYFHQKENREVITAWTTRLVEKLQALPIIE